MWNKKAWEGMKRSLFVIPVNRLRVVGIVMGKSETHRHAEQTKRSKGSKNRPLFDHPIIIKPSPIQLTFSFKLKLKSCLVVARVVKVLAREVRRDIAR